MSRAVVIASSGMDSTLVATKLAMDGHDLTLLHFTYGQRASRNELSRIRLIARFFGARLRILDLDRIGHIRMSSLDARSNTDVGSGRKAAKVAMEWVPARNMVFLAYGVLVAIKEGAEVVALGVNQEEALAIPDNEEAMYSGLMRAAPVFAASGIRIETPIGGLMKEQIVRESMEYGSPLHLTWSCYRGEGEPCGECGSCTQRREAFRKVGMDDPILPLDEIERMLEDTKCAE